MFWKNRLTELYVHHNTAGKTYEDFERDMDRDTFMSAPDALAYGLCDQIIQSRPV
jgi:ATP-dependent Clp protease protease subunit